MFPQKRLNWKVAAGGAIAGVAMGGLAFADSGNTTTPEVNNVQLTPTEPAAALPNGPLASPSSEIVVTEVPVQVQPAPVVLAADVLPPADVVAAVDAAESVSVASVASVASVDSVSVASVSVASVDSVSVDNVSVD